MLDVFKVAKTFNSDSMIFMLYFALNIQYSPLVLIKPDIILKYLIDFEKSVCKICLLVHKIHLFNEWSLSALFDLLNFTRITHKWVNAKELISHNPFTHKSTHNHLATQLKWFSCVMSTYLYMMHWLSVFIMSHTHLEWIYTQ